MGGRVCLHSECTAGCGLHSRVVLQLWRTGAHLEGVQAVGGAPDLPLTQHQQLALPSLEDDQPPLPVRPTHLSLFAAALHASL